MVYVCSDLHGYSLDKFKAFLNKIGFCEDDFLYIIGDVIDRGKDGIKILKWLMSMYNAQLILGNHEQMMLASSFVFEEITDASIDNLTAAQLTAYSMWVANSGQPTIDALAATRQREIKYILEYLQEAPLYETVTANGRDFILTHSGLGSFSPDKKLSDYTSDELLWNRPNIDQKYFDDITVVFGHTPTVHYGEEHKGKILFTDSWIDVDVGAGLGLPPAILRLDDMKIFYCEE